MLTILHNNEEITIEQLQLKDYLNQTVSDKTMTFNQKFDTLLKKGFIFKHAFLNPYFIYLKQKGEYQIIDSRSDCKKVKAMISPLQLKQDIDQHCLYEEGWLAPNGIFFPIDKSNVTHQQLACMIINELTSTSESIYKDYRDYITQASFDMDAITTYFIDRLGFIQLMGPIGDFNGIALHHPELVDPKIINYLKKYHYHLPESEEPIVDIGYCKQLQHQYQQIFSRN